MPLLWHCAPLCCVLGCDCWWFCGYIITITWGIAGLLWIALWPLGKPGVVYFRSFYDILENCRMMTYVSLIGKSHVFLMNYVVLLNPWVHAYYTSLTYVFVDVKLRYAFWATVDSYWAWWRVEWHIVLFLLLQCRNICPAFALKTQRARMTF